MKQLLTLIFLLLDCTYVNANSLITKQEISQLKSTMGSGMTTSDILRKHLAIGHGIVYSYELSITSKGNGGIQLPGIFLLRLYDIHKDSSYFKQGLLHNELIDINGDGYMDILLWGTAVVLSDLGESPREEPVSALLVYSKQDKKYIILRKSKEIDIYFK